MSGHEPHGPAGALSAADLEEAAGVIRSAWRHWVFEYLRAHRRPAGSVEAATALEARHPTIQRAICELVNTRHLVDVGRGADGRPLYQVVEVGACEWCGLVSHRRVASECPACRERSTNAARGIARPVPVSVPGFYVEVVEPASHSHSEV